MSSKNCHLCSEKIEKIEYKDAYFLRRFMNSQGKIYPPKRHGLCAKHQRMLSQAIKRSRIMGFVPFVIK
ncbi:MAG: 30S ribosomal protein S18 [Candidatus Moranbacteria bacterium]|nr:30S ribosomal protein S18 [Candidatus Moranbacteria bacterium]